MEKHQLEEHLRQLRAELREVESLDALDAKDRQLLAQLDADIHKLLEPSEPESPLDLSQLSERVQQSVMRLEASHPNLALVLGQIAEMLARLGI